MSELFDEAEGPFDPYAAESAYGIERDRWDRPLIKPDPDWTECIGRWSWPTTDLDILSLRHDYTARVTASNGWTDGRKATGQLADGRRPYARVSTLAKGIDPTFGLGIWTLRHVMLSLARRPDLCELLATMSYTDGKEIDKIADEAMIRAKDDDTDPEEKLLAAGRGTTFHRVTTPGVESWRGPSLAAYHIAAGEFDKALARHDLEVVSSERFVVSDDLTAAGTYDHLVRDLRTGMVHVLDKKTGTLQWLSHLVQLEGYSSAKHYDPRTGVRELLHEDFDGSIGFIASTNLTTGECDIWELDLDGSLVRLAVDVWKANKAETIKHRFRKRA